MSEPTSAPLVSVKLTPEGRVQTLLPDDRAQSAPRAGNRVVVRIAAGTAVTPACRMAASCASS